MIHSYEDDSRSIYLNNFSIDNTNVKFENFDSFHARPEGECKMQLVRIDLI